MDASTFTIRRRECQILPETPPSACGDGLLDQQELQERDARHRILGNLDLGIVR